MLTQFQASNKLAKLSLNTNTTSTPQFHLFLRICQNSCSRQIKRIHFLQPEHLKFEIDYIKQAIHAEVLDQNQVTVFCDNHSNFSNSWKLLWEQDSGSMDTSYFNAISPEPSTAAQDFINNLELTSNKERLILIFLAKNELNTWIPLLEKFDFKIHIIRHEGDFLVNGIEADCDCDNCLLNNLLNQINNYKFLMSAPMNYANGKQYSMLTYKNTNDRISLALQPSYFCKNLPLTIINHIPSIPQPINNPYKFYAASNNPKYIAAPMVGQSDLAFRMMIRAHQVEMAYTPMINAELFVNSLEYQAELFTTCYEDNPLIPQFAANNPKILAKAITVLLDLANKANCLTNIKYIGINLGCPQNIGRRHKIGAWTMENWELIKQLIISAKHTLNNLADGNIGVECKIRIFNTLPQTLAYAKMLENAGCALLTVHARLRSNTKNAGPANFEAIAAIKKALKIPVIANGSITDLTTAKQCLADTQCDGVMAASSLLTNPYLFEANIIKPQPPTIALEYLAYTETYGAPPISYIRSHILQFFSLVTSYDDYSYDLLEKIKTFRTIDQLKDLLQIANTVQFKQTQNIYKDSFQAVFIGSTKLELKPS